MEQLPELGFYGLPGAPRSPADLLDECRAGEAMGFGSVFLSERFNIKEAAVLSGEHRPPIEFRIRTSKGVVLWVRQATNPVSL